MRKKALPIMRRIESLMKRLDTLPGDAALEVAALRTEFDTLRTAIINYDAERTREDYYFQKDLAESREDHAALMGLSVRALTDLERELGIPRRVPGNKRRGAKPEYRKRLPKTKTP